MIMLLKSVVKSSINPQIQPQKSPLFSTVSKYFYTNFPYKFGGLPQTSLTINKITKQSSQINQAFTKQSFGDNVMNNFIFAYKQILAALQQKDTNYLGNIMEKNLIKNIQFPNHIKLINRDAEVKPMIGKIVKITNGVYNRDLLSKQKLKLVRNSDDEQFLTVSATGDRGTNDLTFLFCFDVYFRSKMKLIQQQPTTESSSQSSSQSSQSTNFSFNSSISNSNKFTSSVTQSTIDNQQLHLIQFQIQNRMPMSQLISKMGGAFFKNLFNFPNMLTQMQSVLIGTKDKKFQWKIGDMDRMLNGNFVQNYTK